MRTSMAGARRVDEWVESFKRKRAQIVDHHCPD
jgi:hypothetical protein